MHDLDPAAMDSGAWICAGVRYWVRSSRRLYSGDAALCWKRVRALLTVLVVAQASGQRWVKCCDETVVVAGVASSVILWKWCKVRKRVGTWNVLLLEKWEDMC
jgi:hypothetical protein